jgi:hypothetical protein
MQRFNWTQDETVFLQVLEHIPEGGGFIKLRCRNDSLLTSVDFFNAGIQAIQLRGSINHGQS